MSINTDVAVRRIRNALESVNSGNINKMQYAAEELYELMQAMLKEAISTALAAAPTDTEGK